MATLRELETALVNAHNAGDTDAARKLAAVIGRARKDPTNSFPDTPVVETIAPEPTQTIGDKIIGTGEAALSTVTGLTGGAVGMVGGTIGGLAGAILSGEFGTTDAANLVEQAAAQGAEKLTYAPRTISGQQQAQAVGEGLQQLVPLTPFGRELGVIAQSTKMGAPVAAARTAAAVEPVIAQAKAMAEPVIAKAKETASNIKARIIPPEQPPTGAPSAGAAGVEAARVKQELNQELPYPFEFTEGTLTRNPTALQFEIETAKTPQGAKFVERANANRARIEANIDGFFDETGATASSLYEKAKIIVDVLDEKVKKEKARIDNAYGMARAQGEMELPTSIPTIAARLNELTLESKSSPILKYAIEKGEQLGVLKVDDSGSITAINAPLKNIVQYRRDIGSQTDWAKPNESRFSTQLKSLIDDDTKTAGGKLYQKANAMRAKLGAEIERKVLIRDLLAYKKNSSDRKIAYESLLNKLFSSTTSRDDIRNLKITLLKEGENGRQAWRELQGGLVQELKDTAFKGAVTDSTGSQKYYNATAFTNRITQLDKSGKLELIFGKKGADKMLLLRDLANDISTVPRGVANESGTSSALIAALDGILMGSGTIPLPVLSGIKFLSKQAKDKKLKARIEKHLNPKLDNEGNP